MFTPAILMSRFGTRSRGREKQLSLFVGVGVARGGAVWVTARQVLWLKRRLWCHIILTEHILLAVSDPPGRSIGNHCLNGNSVDHSWSAPQPRGNQTPAFHLKLVPILYIVVTEFLAILHFHLKLSFLTVLRFFCFHLFIFLNKKSSPNFPKWMGFNLFFALSCLMRVCNQLRGFNGRNSKRGAAAPPPQTLQF